MATSAYVNDVYQLAVAIIEDPGLRDVAERRVSFLSERSIDALDIELYAPTPFLGSVLASQQALQLAVDAALVALEWGESGDELSEDLVTTVLYGYGDLLLLSDLRYSSFWSKFDLSKKVGRERVLAFSLLAAGALHLIALFTPPPANIVIEVAGILVDLAGPAFSLLWPDEGRPAGNVPVTLKTLDLGALPDGLRITIRGSAVEYAFAVEGAKADQTEFVRLLKRSAARLGIDEVDAGENEANGTLRVRLLSPAPVDFAEIEQIARVVDVRIVPLS